MVITINNNTTMKSISKISLGNIKGVTGTYSTGPITVIVGDNESGKSAILDAVTINLLGYHPAIGKTGPSTMQLASADKMACGIEFDDKTTRYASWERTPKGAVKVNVPPAMIADYQVDLAAFQSMKSADRMALLFDRSGGDFDLWKEFVEAIYTDNKDKDALITKCVPTMPMPVVQKITQTVTALNAQRDTARAAVRSATAALQAWDESQSATASGPMISATEFSLIKHEHEKANTRVLTLTAEKTAKDAVITQNEKRLIGLRAELAQAESKLAALNDGTLPMDIIPVVWTNKDEKKLAAVTTQHATLWASIGNHRNVLSLLDGLQAMVDQYTGGFFECPTCHHVEPASSKLVEINKAQIDAKLALSECVTNQERLKTTLVDLQTRKKQVEQSAALIRDRAANALAKANLFESTNASSARLREAEFDQEAQVAASMSLSGAITDAVLIRTTAAAKLLSARGLKQRTDRIEMQSKMRQEKVTEKYKAELAADAIGAVAKTAATKMVELIDGSVQKLLIVGNSIWTLFDQSVICVEEGEIGFRRDGRFHVWGVMSGRQKLIASIAFQVALATGEGRGILMIDEIGRLDATSATMLLHRLDTLISEGAIAQVIVASPVTIMGLPQSTTTIVL